LTRGWPAVLEWDELRLRPLSARDGRMWRDVRARNAEWLKRWDATAPPGAQPRAHTFSSMVSAMRRAARAGSQLPFAIDYQERFVGQITVNNVIRGSAQFASVGYWIDQRVAGRGLMTRAVAMVIDHCFSQVGLHRIEVAIRPENHASLRVVDKLGIPLVGLAPGYLHIDGEWRDHLLFGITREQAAPGLVRRLKSQQSQE